MTHTAGDFESLLAAAKGIATDVAAKHAADVDAKARFPQGWDAQTPYLRYVDLKETA